MRISDWSSDVCSSDLDPALAATDVVQQASDVGLEVVDRADALVLRLRQPDLVVGAGRERDATVDRRPLRRRVVRPLDGPAVFLFRDLQRTRGATGGHAGTGRTDKPTGGKGTGRTDRYWWSPDR